MPYPGQRIFQIRLIAKYGPLRENTLISADLMTNSVKRSSKNWGVFILFHLSGGTFWSYSDLPFSPHLLPSCASHDKVIRSNPSARKGGRPPVYLRCRQAGQCFIWTGYATDSTQENKAAGPLRTFPHVSAGSNYTSCLRRIEIVARLTRKSKGKPGPTFMSFERSFRHSWCRGTMDALYGWEVTVETPWQRWGPEGATVLIRSTVTLWD